MTDGIPPERRCPICGSLNVNAHPNSLCPEHHPAEDPSVTPLDTAETPGTALAEARAVAGQESSAAPDRDVGVARELELVDRFDGLSDRGTEVAVREDQDSSDAADGTYDDDSFMAAAMGNSEAAEEYQHDVVDDEESAPSSTGVGLPTGALPLGQLDALTPEERRRAARKRGLDWPTTDEARDRLKETIHDVLRHEDDRVIDAPTSLGKTHTVASTRWGAREDLTGERPVVHLLETRDARDEAIEIAEEHGGEFIALESRHEACPVAAGDYDPQPDDDDGDADGEDDVQPVTIDGQPASEWLQEAVLNRCKALDFIVSRPA